MVGFDFDTVWYTKENNSLTYYFPHLKNLTDKAEPYSIDCKANLSRIPMTDPMYNIITNAGNSLGINPIPFIMQVFAQDKEIKARTTQVVDIADEISLDFDSKDIVAPTGFEVVLDGSTTVPFTVPEGYENPAIYEIDADGIARLVTETVTDGTMEIPVKGTGYYVLVDVPDSSSEDASTEEPSGSDSDNNEPSGGNSDNSEPSGGNSNNNEASVEEPTTGDSNDASTDDTGNASNAEPTTGDSFPLMPMVVLLAGSLFSMAYLLRKSKQR